MAKITITIKDTGPNTYGYEINPKMEDLETKVKAGNDLSPAEAEVMKLIGMRYTLMKYEEDRAKAKSDILWTPGSKK